MQNINELTNYRKGLKTKILDTAMMLFKKNGIKAVKMDDIANYLSISKRTLYEIYDNKEDLLLEGVKNDVAMRRKNMEEFRQSNDDVLQVILHFYQVKLIEIGSVNPDYYLDMRKYKKVIDYFEGNKVEQKKAAEIIFRRGVDEGYFLPQLNYDIVNRLGDAAMDYVMSSKLYERFALKDIFKNFVSVLLRGYCTEKGQTLLDTKLWSDV
jgi:AcrR family transcriptional regulator